MKVIDDGENRTAFKAQGIDPTAARGRNLFFSPSAEPSEETVSRWAEILFQRMNAMSVRAKFKCDEVSPPDGEGNVQTIRLSPVYGESAENKQFFRWTPSGSITIGTVNASAAKQFEPGKEYYVDFTPAE